MPDLPDEIHEKITCVFPATPLFSSTWVSFEIGPPWESAQTRPESVVMWNLDSPWPGLLPRILWMKAPHKEIQELELFWYLQRLEIVIWWDLFWCLWVFMMCIYSLWWFSSVKSQRVLWGTIELSPTHLISTFKPSRPKVSEICS